MRILVSKIPTHTNDSQSLVHKDGLRSDITSRPIRTAMAKSFRQSYEVGSVAGRLFQTMHSKYATHIVQKMDF
jgi:hypothetical protein